MAIVTASINLTPIRNGTSDRGPSVARGAFAERDHTRMRHYQDTTSVSGGSVPSLALASPGNSLWVFAMPNEPAVIRVGWRLHC